MLYTNDVFLPWSLELVRRLLPAVGVVRYRADLVNAIRYFVKLVRWGKEESHTPQE